ncbi:unnamed protein product [Mesocestoides corti]|uniref:F-box domain-containing protein n=1 Tax=Mesocestoides corti TaxID=53468 RepID=A0A0R3U2Y9_MESCO|nr:unnamed protein product [Mesocestoides corti]
MPLRSDNQETQQHQHQCLTETLPRRSNSVSSLGSDVVPTRVARQKRLRLSGGVSSGTSVTSDIQNPPRKSRRYRSCADGVADNLADTETPPKVMCNPVFISDHPSSPVKCFSDHVDSDSNSCMEDLKTVVEVASVQEEVRVDDDMSGSPTSESNDEANNSETEDEPVIKLPSSTFQDSEPEANSTSRSSFCESVGVSHADTVQRSLSFTSTPSVQRSNSCDACSHPSTSSSALPSDAFRQQVDAPCPNTLLPKACLSSFSSAASLVSTVLEPVSSPPSPHEPTQQLQHRGELTDVPKRGKRKREMHRLRNSSKKAMIESANGASLELHVYPLRSRIRQEQLRKQWEEMRNAPRKLDDLPVEVMLRIVQYLSIQDLFRAQRVNKRLRSVALMYLLQVKRVNFSNGLPFAFLSDCLDDAALRRILSRTPEVTHILGFYPRRIYAGGVQPALPSQNASGRTLTYAGIIDIFRSCSKLRSVELMDVELMSQLVLRLPHVKFHGMFRNRPDSWDSEYAIPMPSEPEAESSRNGPAVVDHHLQQRLSTSPYFSCVNSLLTNCNMGMTSSSSMDLAQAAAAFVNQAAVRGARLADWFEPINEAPLGQGSPSVHYSHFAPSPAQRVLIAAQPPPVSQPGLISQEPGPPAFADPDPMVALAIAAAFVPPENILGRLQLVDFHERVSTPALTRLADAVAAGSQRARRGRGSQQRRGQAPPPPPAPPQPGLPQVPLFLYQQQQYHHHHPDSGVQGLVSPLPSLRHPPPVILPPVISNLTKLDLVSVAISALPKLDNVKYLHLKWVVFTMSDPFGSFQANKLQSFVMNNCIGPQRFVRFVRIFAVLTRAPQLTRLELVGTRFIDGLIEHLVDREEPPAYCFRNLQRLVLAGNKDATEIDVGLLLVASQQSLSHLALQIWHTRNSLFEALSQAGVRLVRLESLILGSLAQARLLRRLVAPLSDGIRTSFPACSPSCVFELRHPLPPPCAGVSNSGDSPTCSLPLVKVALSSPLSIAEKVASYGLIVSHDATITGTAHFRGGGGTCECTSVSLLVTLGYFYHPTPAPASIVAREGGSGEVLRVHSLPVSLTHTPPAPLRTSNLRTVGVAESQPLVCSGLRLRCTVPVSWMNQSLCEVVRSHQVDNVTPVSNEGYQDPYRARLTASELASLELVDSVESLVPVCNFTNRGLTLVFTVCPRLTSLTLRHAPFVTQFRFEATPSSVDSEQAVNNEETSGGGSAEGADEPRPIHHTCLPLRSLTLENCPNVGVEVSYHRQFAPTELERIISTGHPFGLLDSLILRDMFPLRREISPSSSNFMNEEPAVWSERWSAPSTPKDESPARPESRNWKKLGLLLSIADHLSARRIAFAPLAPTGVALGSSARDVTHVATVGMRLLNLPVKPFDTFFTLRTHTYLSSLLHLDGSCGHSSGRPTASRISRLIFDTEALTTQNTTFTDNNDADDTTCADVADFVSRCTQTCVCGLLEWDFVQRMHLLPSKQTPRHASTSEPARALPWEHGLHAPHAQLPQQQQLGGPLAFHPFAPSQQHQVLYQQMTNSEWARGVVASPAFAHLRDTQAPFVRPLCGPGECPGCASGVENPPSATRAESDLKHAPRVWIARDACVDTSELRCFTGPKPCVLTLWQPVVSPFSCLTTLHFEKVGISHLVLSGVPRLKNITLENCPALAAILVHPVESAVAPCVRDPVPCLRRVRILRCPKFAIYHWLYTAAKLYPHHDDNLFITFRPFGQYNEEVESALWNHAHTVHVMVSHDYSRDKSERAMEESHSALDQRFREVMNFSDALLRRDLPPCLNSAGANDRVPLIRTEYGPDWDYSTDISWINSAMLNPQMEPSLSSNAQLSLPVVSTGPLPPTTSDNICQIYCFMREYQNYFKYCRRGIHLHVQYRDVHGEETVTGSPECSDNDANCDIDSSARDDDDDDREPAPSTSYLHWPYTENYLHAVHPADDLNVWGDGFNESLTSVLPPHIPLPREAPVVSPALGQALLTIPRKWRKRSLSDTSSPAGLRNPKRPRNVK